MEFVFTPEQKQAFARTDVRVRIVIDHPEYQADVTLTDVQRDELVGDFAA
jgi:hypothetical protein